MDEDSDDEVVAPLKALPTSMAGNATSTTLRSPRTIVLRLKNGFNMLPGFPCPLGLKCTTCHPITSPEVLLFFGLIS